MSIPRDFEPELVIVGDQGLEGDVGDSGVEGVVSSYRDPSQVATSLTIAWQFAYSPNFCRARIELPGAGLVEARYFFLGCSRT